MATFGEKGRSRWIQAIVAGELAVVLGVVAPPSSGPSIAMDGHEPTPQAEASPYDGAPAEGFAEGAAGIVVPRAEAVPGGYLADHTLATRDITAGEVAEALDDVRAALIATRLDRRMLVDHDPEPFLRNLARLYWYIWFDPYLPELRADDPYELPEFAYLATKLAPGVRLAAEPRVAGRITYGAGRSGRGGAPRNEPWRVLRIVTRFVWVYALEVPDDGASVVVIRNRVVWQVPTDARLDCCRSNAGLQYAVADVRAWGVDCELYSRQGLIRPDGRGDIAEQVFDVDQPSASLGGCQPERDCSLPVVAASCAVVGE